MPSIHLLFLFIILLNGRVVIEAVFAPPGNLNTPHSPQHSLSFPLQRSHASAPKDSQEDGQEDGEEDCSTQSTCRRRSDFTEYERRLLKDVWPMDLLEDPSRQARVVTNAEDFFTQVLVGDHLHDLVVFPGGVEKLRLGWRENVPDDLRHFLRDCKTGLDVAQGLLDRQDMLDRYKWRMDLYSSPSSGGGKGTRILRNRTMFSSQQDSTGNNEQNFLDKLQQVLESSVKSDDVYFAETVLKIPKKHPISGMVTRAVFLRDIKHLLGLYANWTWYWDSENAGLFAGGRFSGTGLHVDQVLWSDVGRNFEGYKLLAAWPPGEVSAKALEVLGNDRLNPPLDSQRLAILQTASKITLLRPGDLYLFSGGVAHSALCVSTDELCLGSYESFVSLKPRHIALWKNKGFPNRKCDQVYCIGDQPSNTAKEALVMQGLNNLLEAASQAAAGGPAAVDQLRQTSMGLEEWDTVHDNLNTNTNLSEKLHEFYTQTVALLMRNKYFRKHVPQLVLETARLQNYSDPMLEDAYTTDVECGKLMGGVEKDGSLLHLTQEMDYNISVSTVVFVSLFQLSPHQYLALVSVTFSLFLFLFLLLFLFLFLFRFLCRRLPRFCLIFCSKLQGHCLRHWTRM